MRDPYEVLGLNRGASQDEIKQRYRELAKKYHPDKYQNNPLADLAEEKLREINEAYDTLTKGFNSQNSQGSSGYGNAGYNSSAFANIRMALDRNDLREAESLLNSIGERSAEWYFLMGMLFYKKGWFDQAITNIQTAVSMDPNNMEYRNVLNQLVGMGGFKSRAGQAGYGSGDSDCCRMMMCYCCIDSMCDCI